MIAVKFYKDDDDFIAIRVPYQKGDTYGDLKRKAYTIAKEKKILDDSVEEYENCYSVLLRQEQQRLAKKINTNTNMFTIRRTE